jgi:hypothetical protein
MNCGSCRLDAHGHLRQTVRAAHLSSLIPSSAFGTTISETTTQRSADTYRAIQSR